MNPTNHKTVDMADDTAIDNLLKHLFADKKAVYVDDINFSADGGYDASWCLEFTLKMSRPQWMDTHLTRPVLLQHIRRYKLNEWEAFRFDEHTGSIQPFTETTHHLETFLDENYTEIIKHYLEESSPEA